MVDVFEQAHAFVARWEGGLDDDPRDPGGITHWGVCKRFLTDFYRRQASFLGSIGVMGPITRQTIIDLTKGQAKKILKKEFWIPAFEEISKTHPRIAMCAYDAAVNIGIKPSVMILQQAVGADADGIIGPKTMAAVRGSSDILAACGMLEMRKAYYADIVSRHPERECFSQGWINRVNALAKEVGRYEA